MVGHGMLTAAVCGDVFASPSSSQVYAAIQACKSTKGVLLIVKNYTGDRLQFGKAAERAIKLLGINVKLVVCSDDCAISDEKTSNVGRRGLAGTLFLHKVYLFNFDSWCNVGCRKIFRRNLLDCS